VIDFIDMIEKRHQAAVERRLRDAVKIDKARIELSRISKFGLLEMSRQRLRASLASQSHLACTHCQGIGKVRNPELVALEVLRKIQSAVIVGHVGLVKARLSPAPALFLLNNKKGELARLESQHGVHIYILADGRLTPDEYEFELEARKPGEERPAAVRAAPPPPPTAHEEEEEPAQEDLEDIGAESPDDEGASKHERIKHRPLRFRAKARRRIDTTEGDETAGEEPAETSAADSGTKETAS